MPLKFYTYHHNKIQFFGYEVANIALVLAQFLQTGKFDISHGLTPETGSALSFMAASVFIFMFHPQKRPTYLFWGGAGLFFGGAFLFAGDYISTGLAVALSGLETMRGGLLAYTDTQGPQGKSTVFYKFASNLLAPYQAILNLVFKRFKRLGQFINTRPFVTGAILRAPTRLEFIVKQALMGGIAGWIGAAVGLSWLLLGDLAIAFNDPKLKAWALKRLEK